MASFACVPNYLPYTKNRVFFLQFIEVSQSLCPISWVRTSVCLSVWFTHCASAKSCVGRWKRSIYLLVCLSVNMSVSLSVCLSVCLPVCLSICLSVCVSTCLSVCLSVCLYVCHFVCLSVRLFSQYASFVCVFWQVKELFWQRGKKLSLLVWTFALER